MSHSDIRVYYDERYRTEEGQAFPFDPSRYRAWFGSLLSEVEPNTRFLDYGCGVGYVCSMFADLGCDTTGIDISTSALRIAQSRESRTTFREAVEAGPLPFDDATFDVIACLGVVEHIPDPAPVVAELRRVARPDATAVWVVPNARSPYFWLAGGTEQIEEHPRSLDGWTALLEEAGWAVVNVRRDPGPIDRPVAAWKRVLQAALNRLPLGLTYQYVIESTPDSSRVA